MTMKITKIDRPACKRIREAVEENLAEILDELGLKLVTKNGTFDHQKFGLKVEFILADADPAKDDFELLATAYGVKPTDYGMGITINGNRYKLTGINTKASKYPFNAERLDNGQSYKFTERSVVKALGYATKPPIFKGEVETI